MQQKLINLLRAISDNAERRFVFLSEHAAEWEELKPYVLDKAKNWNVYDDEGNLLLGRLFYRLMRYNIYDPQDLSESNPVPFHCYEITPGDVVFTDQELEWDDIEGRYIGVMADVMRNMSLSIKSKKDAPTHTHEAQPSEVTHDDTNEPSSPSRSGSGCMVIILALAVVSLTAFLLA